MVKDQIAVKIKEKIKKGITRIQFKQIEGIEVKDNTDRKLEGFCPVLEKEPDGYYLYGRKLNCTDHLVRTELTIEQEYSHIPYSRTVREKVKTIYTYNIMTDQQFKVISIIDTSNLGDLYDQCMKELTLSYKDKLTSLVGDFINEVEKQHCLDFKQIDYAYLAMKDLYDCGKDNSFIGMRRGQKECNTNGRRKERGINT